MSVVILCAQNLSSSWPGLSRPSTSLLHDRWIKVIPFRIVDDNHSNFPCAGPVLDIVLALNRITDVVEPFEIDQSFQSVSFGEAPDESRTMLEYAADKVACHANVQNAIGTIGQNINVSTCHVESLQDVDAGTSPAMTS
jgi:hypothetical protein